MMLEDAIAKACSDVGIIPPKQRRFGKWLQTDTLSGRNGKGDGRVIINETAVTAWNWQTGEKVTVGLNGEQSTVEREKIARNVKREQERKREQSAKAMRIAGELVRAAKPSTHAYLDRKGFPDERALVIDADCVRSIAGDYLAPEGAKHAIVIPARSGVLVKSVQLIWEDGTKKFLFGGEISGTSHRIASGAETWLCEGYATGLSLRAALKGLKRSVTVLCCFSASNLCLVAKSIKGRAFIAADNDKPLPQFGGIGAGEHYAVHSGKPYIMPPVIGFDINDMHCRDGIYAVQKVILDLLRAAR